MQHRNTLDMSWRLRRPTRAITSKAFATSYIALRRFTYSMLQLSLRALAQDPSAGNPGRFSLHQRLHAFRMQTSGLRDLEQRVVTRVAKRAAGTLQPLSRTSSCTFSCLGSHWDCHCLGCVSTGLPTEGVASWRSLIAHANVCLKARPRIRDVAAALCYVRSARAFEAGASRRMRRTIALTPSAQARSASSGACAAPSAM